MAHAEKQYRHLAITQQRERLPVYKLRKELLYVVEKYQTTIVVGQTGCGKTTRKFNKIYLRGSGLLFLYFV